MMICDNYEGSAIKIRANFSDEPDGSEVLYLSNGKVLSCEGEDMVAKNVIN